MNAAIKFAIKATTGTSNCDKNWTKLEGEKNVSKLYVVCGRMLSVPVHCAFINVKAEVIIVETETMLQKKWEKLERKIVLWNSEMF